MKLSLLIAALFFLPPMTWHAVAQTQDQRLLLDRLTGDVAGAVYQLDITQLGNPSATGAIRQVEIRCVEGCKGNLEYREDVSDVPISAFRLWDGSSQLVTIWGSGSAYWVRIYYVSRTAIRKVFEVASKTAPSFMLLPDGTDGMVVQDPDVPSRQVMTSGSLWVWNGQMYVQSQ